MGSPSARLPTLKQHHVKQTLRPYKGPLVLANQIEGTLLVREKASKSQTAKSQLTLRPPAEWLPRTTPGKPNARGSSLVPFNPALDMRFKASMLWVLLGLQPYDQTDGQVLRAPGPTNPRTAQLPWPSFLVQASLLEQLSPLDLQREECYLPNNALLAGINATHKHRTPSAKLQAQKAPAPTDRSWATQRPTSCPPASADWATSPDHSLQGRHIAHVHLLG